MTLLKQWPNDMIYEKAILFVMDFYQVSREMACKLYWDEIEAYMKLIIGVKE